MGPLPALSKLHEVVEFAPELLRQLCDGVHGPFEEIHTFLKSIILARVETAL